MGKTLYLECESGISGDMVVGALLDLGANQERLLTALESLPMDGFSVQITRREVSAIDVCDFDVVLDEGHQNHDHDMAYLYGGLDEAESHSHEHYHEHHGHGEGHHHHEHHEHVHTHEHGHGGGHHHEHRHLSDIERIINSGKLTPRARELAKRIFSILAEAESKAHGVATDEVHFHEAGAVDSIVDVVAAAVCLDDLDITHAIVGPLAEGHGRVRTQHGVLPVPVPAVVNIAASCGLVLAQRAMEGEFVTPTGAAIAAAIRTAEELPATYVVRAVGTGSGKRAYKPVSTLRGMIIEPRGTTATESQPDAHTTTDAAPSRLWKLETEVDDCTGEALGHALERLFEVGVREAHYVPVFMKKSRPAYQVEALCDESLLEAVERVLFEETTTIGVRRHRVERTTLSRREQTMETPLGPARVKLVTLPNGSERPYPEHDSVASLAKEKGVSYQEAFRATLLAVEKRNARS